MWGVQAIDEIDNEIPRSHILRIIGPNGAGKSTLLNVLSGLMLPEQGNVFLGGRDVTGLSPRKMAHLGLMRTFQIARELGQLTVLENMLLAGGQIRIADEAAKVLADPEIHCLYLGGRA